MTANLQQYAHPLVILCIFILLDFISGLLKALSTGSYESSKMRKGLYHKLGEIFAFLFCLVCDLTLPEFNVVLPFQLTTAVTVYIVIMEIGSIVENIGVMNPEIGKYLSGVFEKVQKDHDEK